MTYGTRKRPRKYIKGLPVATIHGAVIKIVDGRTLMVRGKPMGPHMLRNWSLATLKSAVDWGDVYEADINPEWRKENP